MYRIIGVDGKEYGPISADQLRQWIAENRANSSTPVLVEGAVDWKPLGTIPEFSLLFASRQQPYAAPAYPARLPGQKNTGLAVTGMILGIVSVSIGLCCCYGLPFNILGLIFSIIAFGQANSDPERYGGKGMAIAGIILCGVSLLIMVIMILVAGAAGGWDEITRHHGYRL